MDSDGDVMLYAHCLFRMSREQLAVQRARRSFQTGRTKPLEFRIHQLKSLLSFISHRRREIADAVKRDLGKVGQSHSTGLQQGPEVQEHVGISFSFKLIRQTH